MKAVPRRTAEDALRLVPGMTLVQHGSEGKGYQYFLRGFDAVHGAGFEVDVLGIPMNEWSNIHAQGYVDLGFVIPETIAGVDVVKGPFELDQGAFAMAGSANYRLGLEPEDVGVRTSMTVGTTGRLRGLVSYAAPERFGEDFVALEGTVDSGFGQNRSIGHGTVLGLTRLFDSRRIGRISVLSAAHAARFELPGSLSDQDVRAGYYGFYDSYDTAQRGETDRGLLGLIHEWQGEHVRLRTTVHGGFRHLDLIENYTGFLVDPANGDRRQQIQRTVQTGLNMRGDWDPSRVFGLRLGVGATVEAFSQAQAHLGRDLEQLERVRDLEGTQLAAHALVGAHVHPTQRLTLEGGLRFDFAQVDAQDAISEQRTRPGVLAQANPRLTAAYRPVDAVEFRLAYGRGFRPPEAQALVPPEGDTPSTVVSTEPNMVPIDSAEIGVRWSSSRYLALRLIGFGSYIQREAVFDHISGQTLEMNGTRRFGTEAGISSSPLPFLTLSADVTWVDARFVESQDPIPFAPWLMGSFSAIATHDSGLHGGLRLLGLAPRTLPHEGVGSGLFTTDLTAGYAAKTWRLDLELENLFDLALREGESMFASVFPPGPPSALPVRHFSAAAPRNARLTLTFLF